MREKLEFESVQEEKKKRERENSKSPPVFKMEHRPLAVNGATTNKMCEENGQVTQ